MLLAFTVSNFLSIKERATLSLMATPIKEFEDSNLWHVHKHKLLNGAVIYGANASGKSNFIKAMDAMRRLVLHSVDQSSKDFLDLCPFLLCDYTEEKPSLFECSFIIDDKVYRYGFEADNYKLHAEWLFETKSRKEKPLFLRQLDAIEVMPAFAEGKDLEERTRDNALFISVVDQFNGALAKKIIAWFDNLITVAAVGQSSFKSMTLQLMKDPVYKAEILQFFKTIDLNIEDLNLADSGSFTPHSQTKSTRLLGHAFHVSEEAHSYNSIKAKHQKFNANNEAIDAVSFDMDSQESTGTNKLFNLMGPLFNVLKNGGILAIDELDSSLHPHITLAIIQLFHSAKVNKNKAQFIIVTHDTNLLQYGHFRRDQIYFVEKDRYGASHIYSLVEFKEEGKTVRSDRSFEKDYIDGRYGGIPYIKNINKVLN